MIDLPEPEPGPGEVVVRVRACGVCGSDNFLQAGGFASVLPIVPGHEAAGVVAALGPGVDTVAVGQPAALYYIRHCGTCRWCRAGRPNLCLTVERMGVDFDGAFAELVVLPQENVIPVDPDMSPAATAVLTDAVATPYHALTRIARAAAGETVVVFGVGGLGSNGVQLAAHLGCRVIAVSRSTEKLELATELGAEVTIRANEDVAADIRAVTGPSGPDVVLQTVGSATVDEQAIAAAGNGCRVVLVGSTTTPFSTRSVDLIWRELSVLGSRGFVPDDIRDVIALHRSGAIVTDHLVSASRPLSEINEALDDLRAGRVMRSVVTFGDGWG
jgi:2-desacetyl-2-hydroxyethyl bacteriochlorophyllide A dehydrogenase